MKNVQDIELIVKSNGGFETQEQIDHQNSTFKKLEEMVNTFVKNTMDSQSKVIYC